MAVFSLCPHMVIFLCMSVSWSTLLLRTLVLLDQDPLICPHFAHCYSVAQSCLTFVTPWTEHTRLPCPSLPPGVCSNSGPLSWWYHPTISSSVIPFCLQSFPASESFPMSHLFEPSGQSIGASASASFYFNHHLKASSPNVVMLGVKFLL